MNEKLRNLHTYLNGRLEGLPDFNTFQEDLNNPEKRKSFYQYLSKQNLVSDIPTLDKFESAFDITPAKEVDPLENKIVNEAMANVLSPQYTLGKGIYDFFAGSGQAMLGGGLQLLNNLQKLGLDKSRLSEKDKEYASKPFDLVNKFGQELIDKGNKYEEKNAIDNPLYKLGTGTGTLLSLGVLSAINPVLGVGGGFIMEGGSAYNDAKDYGLGEKESLVVGSIVGTINSVLESYTPLTAIKNLGLGKISKELSSKILEKSLWKEFIRGGLSEGSEEALQEITNLIAESIYKDIKDKPELKEWWDRIGESALYGAILGSGMHGASLSIGKEINKKRIDNAIKEIHKEGHKQALGELIDKSNPNYVPNIDLGMFGNSIEAGLLQKEKELNKNNETVSKNSSINDKEFVSQINNNIQKELDSSDEYKNAKEQIANVVKDIKTEPNIKRELIEDLTNYKLLNQIELKPILEQKYGELIDIPAIEEKLASMPLKIDLKGYLDNASKQITEKYLNDEAKRIAKEEDYISTKPTAIDRNDVSTFLYQAAFHGTPHTFDQFSLDAIGSGEGAQAFGWGLYFSQSKNIAKDYAENLSKRSILKNISNKNFVLNTLQNLGISVNDAMSKDDAIKLAKNKFEENKSRLEEFKQDFAKMEEPIEYKKLDEQYNIYEDEMQKAMNNNDMNLFLFLEESKNQVFDDMISIPWYRLKVEIENIENHEMPRLEKIIEGNYDWETIGQRNLYGVSLFQNLEGKEDLLDWNEKISEIQKNKILNQLKKENIGVSEKTLEILSSNGNAQSLYNNLSYDFAKEINNKNFPEWMQRRKYSSNDKATSQFLKRAGIDGIKYKAIGGTGGRSGDIYNYVVFDPKDITMENRIIYQKGQGKGQSYSNYLPNKTKLKDVVNIGLGDSTSKIDFEEDRFYGYRERTIKNASADATIALAIDFNSAGERLTKSSVLNQNKKYIPIDANNLEVTKERVDKIVNELNSIKSSGGLKPSSNQVMSYKMPAKENLTGKDTSTLELVEQGLRTATTRSFPLGKVGDIITFEGRPQKYRITEIEQLTKEKVENPEWVKKWSKKEQWTQEYFKSVLGGKTVHIGSYQTSFEKVEDTQQGISLNIAGNGIYTMKSKYTQEQIDEFTYRLLKAVVESPNLKNKIKSIRTGGQTGFDEAGAKAGVRLGISTKILAPKGWKFRNINGVDISDKNEFQKRFFKKDKSTINNYSQYILNSTTIKDVNLVGLNPIQQKLFDWVKEQKTFNNIKIVPTTFKTTNNKAGYLFDPKTNTATIYINKNAFGTETDFAQSILHESIHAFTVASLDKKFKNYDKQFDDNISQIREFTKKHLETIEHNIDPYSLSNNMEFLANIFANDTDLNKILSEIKLEDVKAKNLLQKIFELIKDLFTKYKLEPSLLDALEIEMNKKFGTPFNQSKLQNINVAELTTPNLDLTDDIQDAADRLVDIAASNIRDKRVLDNLLKVVDKTGKFKSTTDIVQNLQNSSYNDFKKTLLEFSPLKDAMDKKYEITDTYGLTPVEFRLRLVDQLWDKINSLRKVTHLSLDINSNKVQILPENFVNKDGNKQSSWISNMKLLEMIPELEQLVGSKLEVFAVDHIISGKYTYRITDEKQWNNALYSKAFQSNGYYYLGTFADKKKSFVIKADNKIFPKLKEFEAIWKAKYDQFVQQTNIDINQYQFNPDNMNLFRILLEDIRLGGQLDEQGNWQTALYNPDSKDTFDFIAMGKRAYLVSEMGYTENDSPYINDFMKELPEDAGIRLDEKGLVQINSAIFDSKKLPEEFADYINNLKNKYGTERTDGTIFYLIRNDEKSWADLYRQIHGIIKPGVIKPWISNSFKGKSFRDPLYVKSAVMGINENTPLGIWMKEHNLGLLMSDTAAKVKGNKQKVQLFSNDLGNANFEIPLNEIQRIQEKGDVKDAAFGLGQLVLSNFAHESNISFNKANKDNVFEKFVNGIMNANRSKFEKKIGRFQLDGLKDFLKNRILEGTSDKSIAAQNILIPLLESNIDIRTLLNHPYFSTEVKSYFNSLLKDYKRFKAPGTYATIQPDLGALNSLFEKSRKQLTKVFGEERGLSVYKGAFDEFGNIKKGYSIISSNIAKEHNIKLGDKFIHNCTPSNNFTAAGGSICVGIIGKSDLEAGSIVLNSEYIQTLVGKDFDLDTILIHPYNPDYHDKENYNQVADMFNEISNNYEKDILNVFENTLGRNFLENIRLKIAEEQGRNPEEVFLKEVIYSKEAQLAYILKFNKTNENAKPLGIPYNPLGPEVYDIENKFNKKVGDPIHRRSMLQLLSQIGFETSIFGQSNNLLGSGDAEALVTQENEQNISKINPIHKRTYLNHLLLGYITDAFVDAPTNTNLFYFEYDPLLGVAQDLGITKSSPEVLENIKKINDALFRNAINLYGEYWKDESSETNWDYYLDLIAQQKYINNLIKTKNKDKLIEFVMQNSKQKGIEIVENYIDNINYDKIDFSKSPIMKIIEDFNFEDIPFIGIEKERYAATENNALEKIIDQDEFLKKHLLNNEKIIDDILAKEKLTELTKEEKRLVELWYSTAYNPKLHKAKAVLLQLLNPDKEYDSNQRSILSNKNENNPGRMGIVAREYAYPKLFKVLLEQKAIEFEKNSPEEITIKFNNKDYVFTKVDNILKINKTDFRNIDSESELYKELINPKGIFSIAKNREELDRMFNLRNRINTPYFSRIKEAEDFLNKVMPEFNNNDIKIFWNSLLGADPNANKFIVNEKTNRQGKKYYSKEKLSKLTKSYNYPINTIPDFSTEGIKSNDLLLQMIANSESEINKEVLTNWAKNWVKSYNGFTQTDINQLKDHINYDEMLESIIYYRKTDDNIAKESQSTEYQFKNIKGMADSEKVNPYKSDNREVGYSFSFDNIYKILTGKNIAEYHYPINNENSKSMDLDFNDIHIYEKQTNDLMKEISQRKLAFQSLMDEVKLLEDNILGSKPKLLARKKLEQEIFDLVEENPDKISMDENGNYYLGDNLLPYTKQELFDEIGKGEDYNKKLEIALKFHKLYSIDNLKDIQTVIKYLVLLKNQVRNTNKEQFFTEWIKHYSRKYEAMAAMKFKYMPHVYSREIFDNKVMPVIRKTIEKEIRKDAKYHYDLKQLNELGKSTIPYNNEYADNYKNEEWIQTKVKEEMDNGSKYISDSMNSFNPFFMKRSFPDIDGKIYQRSSLEPHVSHNMKFYDIVFNDLLAATELVFEDKAVKNNISEIGLLSVRLKTGDLATHEYYHNTPIKMNEIKKGMDIAAFRNEQVIDQNNNLVNKIGYISGIVKNVDKDNIYFDIGEKTHEKLIRSEIAKYKKTSMDISAHRNGDLPLTTIQLKKLNDLRALGHSSILDPTKLTTAEANAEILQGLINQLRDKKNWGKVPKNQLHIEQYVEGELKNVSGVRRRLEYQGWLGDKTNLHTITKLKEFQNIHGENKYSFRFLGRQYNPIKFGKSFLFGQWLDRAVVNLYLGTPKQAAVNAYRGHAALFINDTFGYAKRYLNPFTFLKYHNERKRIINDVKTAIEEGDFEVFYKKFYETTNTEKKNQLLKRHFALESIVEEGLFRDEEMQRIVAESNAFDGMMKWNSMLDNVKTLYNVFASKSDYKAYKNALKKQVDILNTSTDKSAVENAYKRIEAIESEWLLSKQKQTEGNYDFDIQKIDVIIQEKLNEIQQLKKDNKFDKNAFDILEQVEMTKAEAGYASAKLAKEFVLKSLLKAFSSVERMNRLSTILYTVTKGVDQGITLENSEKLKVDIDNAVGISQGFYDVFNRRLGDRPGPQRMIFKFSQYPYYNFQNSRLMIKQGMQQVNGKLDQFMWYALKGFFFGEKMTDKKLREEFIQDYIDQNNITDINQEKKNELMQQYNDLHKNDLIKPGEVNIPAKVFRGFIAQGWLRSLGIALSGLTLDSFPVYDTIYDLIVGLTSIFKDGDFDDDDLSEWDTQMLINGMLSYFVGIGITLPLNAGINIYVWDNLSNSEKDQKISSVVPPLAKDGMKLYEIATNQIQGDYATQELFRLGTNLKPFSHSYKSQTENEKFYTKQEPLDKLKTALNPISLGTWIPLLREFREKDIIKKSNPLYKIVE